jgi:uroporphyrinogen decarboxylase
MDKNLDNFVRAVRRQSGHTVPAAFIVDSPWLPGYANIDTLDYYLSEDTWLKINLDLRERFPTATWIPGFWWEYGMAIEASAYGSRLIFHHDQPPSVEPLSTDLQFWKEHIKAPNPETDGLMPLVLRQMERMDQRLEPMGLGQHFASARGMLTVTSWFMGVSTLMESLITETETITLILEIVTDSTIRWLDAQLARMREPLGILLLDDLVGMISKRQYLKTIDPLFRKIWDHYDGMIKIYHNDTPCEHLFPVLADTGFNVFNFSHMTDIAAAQKLMGDQVLLMGNVAPRDLGAFGTPEEVYQAAWNCLEKVDGKGMILSFGGGVSPNTPAENIDAMCKAADNWNNKTK